MLIRMVMYRIACGDAAFGNGKVPRSVVGIVVRQGRDGSCAAGRVIANVL